MKLPFLRDAIGFFLCVTSWLTGTMACAQTPTDVHSTEMLERYGKPYVMVTINGRGPFRFVIDTGTGGDALVTPELAAELGLPSVGQATLSDPSGQGGKKVRIVQIDSLNMGGRRVHQYPRCRAHVLRRSGHGARTAGIYALQELPADSGLSRPASAIGNRGLDPRW